MYIVHIIIIKLTECNFIIYHSYIKVYVLLDRCLVPRKESVLRRPSLRACISFLYIEFKQLVQVLYQYINLLLTNWEFMSMNLMCYRCVFDYVSAA